MDDIELRSCSQRLLSDGEHTTAEIVKWWIYEEKPACHTLAYWIKNEEGFDLKFVFDRPFKEDKDIFWMLAKYGQELLEDDL